jgi:transcriptional regulator with PAS, ATPase and Fis domain
MKYLLYHAKGFLKKYPLEKKTITIGRGDENDLIIDDQFISRVHVKVTNEEEGITIEDLDSTNGIFVKTDKIDKSSLKIGDSFSIGGVEVFLKEGNLEEFKTAAQLESIFNGIQKDNKRKFRPVRTKVMADVYNEMLKQILYSGLRKKNFSDFLSDLSIHLSGIKHFGNLFLISQTEGEINILFSLTKSPEGRINLSDITGKRKEIFDKPLTDVRVPGSPGRLFSFPITTDSRQMALLYLATKNQHRDIDKRLTFLTILAEEIHLFFKLTREDTAENRLVNRSRENWIKTDPFQSIDIIAVSDEMKELEKQSKKMAASDIFVLIQGESGTGKELFARLIHKHSPRSKKPFIALNCASIPENLLESELFGYEKGAFTGAYERKQGKLEMASGGTLVLDEIGDMPLNLQSKLLRALQENEFYRLGGTESIKVDLRIISITNKDIGELIRSEKFRNDLYFRLVHRALIIPPLRDRKEDISVLINHFTNLFCRQSGKTLRGYSLKAFQILQNYDWVGNVRQLQNEIRSIVSLVDDDEMVTDEVISEEIKAGASPSSEDTKVLALGKNSEQEKNLLLQLLEKHDWNQSRCARELNMTYWGFHKKILRLGITLPKKK